MEFWSRRHFLRSGLTLLAAVPTGRALAASAMMRGMAGMSGMGNMGAMPAKAAPFARPLPIPPLYAGTLAKDGVREYRLQMGFGSAELQPGVQTPTWGYNGNYLGPALVIPRGEPLRLWVHNALNQSTTTHWHGAHVPGDMDGGPQSLIAPGATRFYQYRIEQDEATLWYHPHPDGRTGPHVYGGLAGLYLIQDGTDRNLGLPHHWGVDDIPIIVQDRLFDSAGRLVYMPQAMDVMGMKGNRFLVNGCESPVLRAPAQWLRLRLLNASNSRIYNFAFSDDRHFYQIATDASYLESPVTMRRLLLGPAQRAEILVDLRSNEGQRLWLRSDSAAVVPGLSRRPMDSDHYDRSVFDLVEIRVERGQGQGGRLPDRLLAAPDLPTHGPEHQFSLQGMGEGQQMMADMRRVRAAFQHVAHSGPGGMSLGIGKVPVFSINHQFMDMQRINLRIPLGSTQVWMVHNEAEMAHTFHVHGTSFWIQGRNGHPATSSEHGWKDTLLIRPGEQIQIAMSFHHPATDAYPYMYHCHMLEHEDNGMMGQFTVLPA